MNYYSQNIGDYASATRGLSLIEHGAYRLMLDLYYQDEKALPANLEALCRKVGARSKEERAAVAFIAGNPDFFEERDGKLYQPRCEREIARFREKSEKASANGSKGGRRQMFAPKVPQGTKADAKPSLSERLPVANQSPSDDEADAKPSLSESLANQEPITNNQEPETKNQEKAESKAIGASAPHPAAPSVRTPDEPPEVGRFAAQVHRIFEHWKTVCDHPQAKLGDASGKRYRTICARLKDGYTEEQLRDAIDGCKRSPHHQGENDRSTVYDDIELICRDQKHVDGFLRLASQPDRTGLSANGRRTVAAAEEWLQETSHAAK